jgi:succinate dehydrogenase / fumarate reductase flavoprotein subunit
MAKSKKDSIVEIAVEAAKEVVETVKEAAQEIKQVVEENETIDAKIPEGPLAEKWTNYKAHQKLVNPANKRKLDVIVVGTGLAGASAAASLAEMGFNVLNFCIQDSPRRAHSIAAQGGINAAKNYQNDGDSVYRLFYDTIKGGDYRAREANVYRLAEVSNNIIDQCVAQGVPFAREYGGLLDNRSFGGAQVSRTFYAKGQTGQQLLLGAYSALSRQIGKGKVKMYSRYEMLDVVVIDGRARGIIARNLVTGRIERFFAHAVVVGTGGYGNAFFLSTNAMASNGSAAMQMYRKGAYFSNPCYAQIHPTCIPVHGAFQSKLTLMSESLRNDGRIWVPKKLEDAKALQAGKLKGRDIPEEDRDYYLERRYPAFGNLVPRDVASRAAKERCDAGYGVNSTGLAVFLDFSDAIKRLGKDVVEAKYGNLFQMYEKIVDENPYEDPMMIFPAIHYTMGGVWVDYELQTSVKGLFCIGEANFSDHGANRLGASALMQGLADGYFVLPYTIQNYLADQISVPRMSTDLPEFVEAENAIQAKIEKLMSIQGKRSVDSIHRELGLIMWDFVGMGRTKEGLETALTKIKEVRKEFWSNVFIPGKADDLNNELEKALRLADFIEIGELMARDALMREESCGGHFREEYQTPEGEALRQDDKFSFASCWKYMGEGQEPKLLKEKLDYEFIKRQTRNYKS